MKNEFEQEKFQEINFLKDISDYEPKLPDVKYSELTNQLTVTIPKKQLKQLENNLLKKVKKLLNLKIYVWEPNIKSVYCDEKCNKGMIVTDLNKNNNILNIPSFFTLAVNSDVDIINGLWEFAWSYSYLNKFGEIIKKPQVKSNKRLVLIEKKLILKID